ncbi:kinase-like protein [Gigaspora margarita]|uniref:Kinase-like protein n=1 Tax=Gigaspora margarita TaxID=4874 RepID=A0A8H4ALL0_GIGMA|nr:kinase-like protein [Gigaspora margarita]
MVDSQQNSQQQLDSQQHELQITDAQQQEGAAQKISVEQQEGVQKDNMISAAEAFQKLKDSDVKRYNYSSFKDNKFLGEGAFADVFSATFENKQYALKHMKNKDLDDEMFKTVTRELQILHKVNHTNVIKFYGISEDIIHRDLHSKNVLINNDNNDRALIADFGLSKQLDEASSVSLNLRGMLGYIEPQCFINTATKRDKKSDIYSLGVLFWELTSGIPPFTKSDVAKDKFAMFTEIGKGLRETPIDDTPQQYKELYTECWSTDPNQRPALARILDDLTGMSETDVEFITNIVPENKRTQTFSSLFSDTKLIHELWQIFLKSTNRGNEFRQISKMIKDSDEDIPFGQCNLARCYKNGIGTEKNLDLAKTWYQKASDNGHKDAEKQLAQLSSKTKGIGLTSFFKAKENNIQSDGNNH